jgi:hypothetical protein
VTDRNPTVVVTSEETLPGIVDRLRGEGRRGQVVDLVVPIDSSLLLTATEFRALKEAIDNDRLHVVLRSADPLRLQLGERLGIPTRALPRPKPAAAAPPLIVPRPSVGAPIEHGPPDGAADSSPMAPTRDPESLWPGLNGQEEQSDNDSEAEGQTEESRPARLENPPQRWLPVAVVLVLLVLGALAAMRVLVPRAVITIVPRTEPVAASLVFDVTRDGQPLDGEAAFALPLSTRTLEATWTGSVPVTGVRVEPVDPAAGPIELRNAGTEPVTVAAGTTVATETGVEFAFVEDVTVPAADAATGEPGAATGTVRAVALGTGGNVGTGEIGGRLANGIYYSNRMEPTEGGTDRELPVVAASDLEALAAQAREAAPALAAQVLAAEDQGQVAVPSLVTVKGQADTFDHAAGDEVDAVALDSVLTLEVMAYDGDAAAEATEAQLLPRLGAVAPVGFAIDPRRVAYDAPVEAAAPEDGVRLEIAARAEAVAVLDENEREALAAALVGKSPEEAAAILATVPEIATFEVDYQPGWLPRQMPGNTARIEFETAS